MCVKENKTKSGQAAARRKKSFIKAAGSVTFLVSAASRSQKVPRCCISRISNWVGGWVAPRSLDLQFEFKALVQLPSRIGNYALGVCVWRRRSDKIINTRVSREANSGGFFIALVICSLLGLKCEKGRAKGCHLSIKIRRSTGKIIQLPA
jgi:hypothetical protein